MPKKLFKKSPPPTFTEEELTEVDSPSLSDELLRSLRPAKEAAPQIVDRYRKTRGPGKKPTKILMSLRIDPDVYEAYKKTGARWQVRMVDDLRWAAKKRALKKKPSTKKQSTRKTAPRRKTA